MCVIIDTNAAHEMFGDTPTPAGQRFLQWLEKGKCKLAVGGQLRKELRQVGPNFLLWAQEATLKGKLVNINDNSINEKTKIVANDNKIKLKSNDPHIIALAQVSGARLLFSNDEDLQNDFGNHTIIKRPRGKVYSTKKSKSFTQDKRKLLDGYHCKPCIYHAT